MRAQIREDGQWSGEIFNRRKSGEIFPVHLSVTAVRNSLRQITHYVSIFYDTSAEKAAERTLVEMSKIKSEFISTAAHELRTPLSAIMGYTEFVRHPDEFGGFSRGQINEFLDEIIDRGEALSRLIDDLLDISRIESGKPINLDLQEVCLVSVLLKSAEFFKVHAARHRFVVDIPTASEETLCVIDRYRINQVLENLLSNAVKYSPAGREIFLRCHQQGDAWAISVADQGIGMTPEQVERVFDKFYRADSSNTAVSGLGLGMSIARQIIEDHGGRIAVQSSKGVGTICTFTLPRKTSSG
jgi:signal transduction histidine kinase